MPGTVTRRLGYVRGEHDAAAFVRLKHLLLFEGGQTRVERHDLDLAADGRARGQRLDGV